VKDLEVFGPPGIRLKAALKCPNCQAPIPFEIEILGAVEITISGHAAATIVEGQAMIPKDDAKKHIRSLSS